MSDDNIIHFNPWNDFNDAAPLDDPFGVEPDTAQIATFLDVVFGYCEDVILGILLDAASDGHLYTINQFAEAFENTAGLGGKDTIRERLNVLSTKGFIKFLRDAKPYGLAPSRSRFGYLCVEGMEFPGEGEQVDPDTGEVQPARISVRPTHYKSPRTGALLEVENPEIWVYAQEDRP